MAEKDEKEWLEQAEFDLGAAETMFKDGRYNYTIFMCHLSIEKALKAIYFKKFQTDPPRVHNLLFFIEKCELKPDRELYDFIFTLSGLSVPTRYPEQLKKVLATYDEGKTRVILKKTGELLQWAKENL